MIHIVLIEVHAKTLTKIIKGGLGFIIIIIIMFMT